MFSEASGCYHMLRNAPGRLAWLLHEAPPSLSLITMTFAHDKVMQKNHYQQLAPLTLSNAVKWT